MGFTFNDFPDSKVHGANMGPISGRQDPGGSHVGPMNLAIWVEWGQTFPGLTHRPLMPHILRQLIGSALVEIMVYRLLGAKPLSKSMLIIVNWTLRNNFQCNFNQNTKLFIHENAFETIVCEMLAILSIRDKLTFHMNYFYQVRTPFMAFLYFILWNIHV